MRLLALALLGTTATMAPAAAQTALGLTGDRKLVTIDLAAAAVTGSVEVATDMPLLGIDWRPATGQVIGVTADHRIVAIDPATGAATELSVMATMLPLMADQPVIVDFNPAADRLRFMTGMTNHRVNVDTGDVTVDGDLAYGAGDANEDEPMIVAASYINSFGTAETTGMFNIDAGMATLVRQAPPNDGVLATVGALGVDTAGPVAFDVATTPEGQNTAWLAASGMLHIVDLETGAVTESWAMVGGDMGLRDLTVLPAM
jgi:hypothetical protein